MLNLSTADETDDGSFHPFRDVLDSTERFEDIEQEIATTCQHGDLHGLHVLCDGSGNAAVIDFGNVGPAPSCTDPIVLELSVSFHKDSPFRGHSWPTVQQSEAWFDVDEYLQRCPVPNFVAACRDWANEASTPAGLSAVLYAEAVRQLKCKDTNHPRVLGIACAAMRNRVWH